MNKHFKPLSILAAIALFVTACAAQVVHAQPEEQDAPKTAIYQTLLGKALSDREVADFIVGNACSPADQFQLCKDAGIAFWTDSDQIVKMVYLYSGYAEGFKRYQGALPFGLSFYDPMWRVEEKLRNLNDDTFQQAGLPDEGSSPDHFHYWAVYKQLGMTVIYNAPVPDQDAYIYAVLVSK